MGYTTTNRHGVAPLDFVTVSGCDLLVIGITHARGGTLDLLMTDVPDLVRVAVVAPLGRSDYSSFSISISKAQAIPNLCVSNRVLLKHRVNWSPVCNAIGVFSWRSIWSADNPVERLNIHLSMPVDCFVPTKVIPVIIKQRINLGLMMTEGLHSTSSRGAISGGLVITLEVTVMSLSITRRGSMQYMPRLCVSLVSEDGMFL